VLFIVWQNFQIQSGCRIMLEVASAGEHANTWEWSSHLGGTCDFLRAPMTTFLGADGIGSEAVLFHVSACRQRNHNLDPTTFFLFSFFFSPSQLSCLSWKKQYYYSIHSSLLERPQCFFYMNYFFFVVLI